MKKIIASCSALAILSCAAAAIAGGPELPPPALFNGFNVGVEGVFWHSTFDSNAEGILFCDNHDTPADSSLSCQNAGNKFGIFDEGILAVIQNDGDAEDLAVAGGFQGTYGWVFQGHFAMPIYLGITGFFDLSDVDEAIHARKHVFIRPDAIGQVVDRDFGALDVDLTTHVKMDNVWGVTVKPGVLLAADVLAYLRFGVAWSDIEASSNIFVNVQNIVVTSQIPRGDTKPVSFLESCTSNDEVEAGFLVGIGIEKYFSEHMTLSLEYNYIDFGRVSAGPGLPASIPLNNFSSSEFFPPEFGVQATEASTRVTVSSFKAGLNIYFNT